MSVKSYLLSLPERITRSVVGLGAGVARETAEVVLPRAVRRGQLYQNLVDVFLRFLIEQVGGAEGVYRTDDRLPEHFLVRRTAGNLIEVLGLVAFRASPVWVLAALSDLCGMGRHLIPEIATALKAEGLLDADREYTTVDQMLDGLERTSGRLAATVNTPPLDVAALRDEWRALQEEARRLPPGRLPSRETVAQIWRQLTKTALRQERSIVETSSMMAVATVRGFPDRARWLAASSRVSASRTSQVFGAVLLEHYRQTLAELQQVGYATFAARQCRPYLRAAAAQFSPSRRTLTDRAFDRLRIARESLRRIRRGERRISDE